MKKFSKLLCLIFSVLLCFACLLGCGEQNPAVLSIEKTGTDGLTDTYTITTSDGKTYDFTVTNGKDGNDGENGTNGVNGKDGENGEDITIEEIYLAYKAEYGEISYADFLKEYLSLSVDDNAMVINSCLRSTAKVYSEFVEQTVTGYPPYATVSTKVAIYTGSAVIYKMESEYSYLITNYHVVFDKSAVGEDKIARAINIYLYGSESKPSDSGATDEDGHIVYDYGSYAISCEYLGGSIASDIAVIRAKTEDILAVNEDAAAVTLASGYTVGETAIAIGNAENDGLSVTEGIISVDSENIALAIDGTSRYYRSIRIDTALYSGNSGGGLFNKEGKLIGITNAGNTSDQNINFAIPLNIVTGAADNIIYHFIDGDDQTKGVYKPTFGFTVTSSEARYAYDESTGYGKIVETLTVTNLVESSIAVSSWGLTLGDKVTAITVDGVTYKSERLHTVSDAILTMRPGDGVSLTVEHADGQTETLPTYILQKSDFLLVD